MAESKDLFEPPVESGLDGIFGIRETAVIEEGAVQMVLTELDLEDQLRFLERLRRCLR